VTIAKDKLADVTEAAQQRTRREQAIRRRLEAGS
jgi:hypothetical protein